MARFAMDIAGPQQLAASVMPFVGKEGTTQTYLKGAVLIVDTGDSNRLDEAGTDPNAIVGVAAKAAAGIAGTDMPYYPAMMGAIFEASIDTNTALGTGALAASDLFAEYGITKDASNVWYVDKAKTGVTGVARIVGFKDAIGAVNGRVYFTFSADMTVYEAT